MTELRVAFRTLGCKLNQLETESIADRFAASGARIVPFESGADLYVINTCTVTGKAEQKARRTIRQALAACPSSVVLVTGCYAQMDPGAISALDQRAVVVPGDEKARVLDLAAWLDSHWQGHGDLLHAVLEWRSGMSVPSTPTAPIASITLSIPGVTGVTGSASQPGADHFAYHPNAFSFHSRPGLKIQDGCDNRCTYCRVCIARGSSISLASPEVLSRVRALESSGKAEVVLTGVNLAQYRDGNLRFPELLRMLHEGTDRIAFRISSYEPEKIDEEFLAAFALPRIRPHVHLALQSGSDSVLKRMARPYTAARVRQAAASLRAAKEDPFVGVDLISGFPGETDVEFAETLGLCRELDFAWIHAFPFSARPGTKAWDMRPCVPERIAGERVAILGALAHSGKASFAARQAGKTLDLVLEQSAAESDGLSAPFRFGTSANYLKTCVEGVPPGIRAGTAVRVLVSADTPENTPESQVELAPEHSDSDLHARFLGLA
ncbi:MAG: tRNA (N(6)-L-threonylcarbamoyladenosine(37)-C(2))-methylthiotransferase MtaB [Rectinemataceae bacterium]